MLSADLLRSLRALQINSAKARTDRKASNPSRTATGFFVVPPSPLRDGGQQPDGHRKGGTHVINNLLSLPYRSLAPGGHHPRERSTFAWIFKMLWPEGAVSCDGVGLIRN